MGLLDFLFGGWDVERERVYGIADTLDEADAQVRGALPDNAYDIAGEHGTYRPGSDYAADVLGMDTPVDTVAVSVADYSHDPHYDPDLSTDRAPVDHPINDLNGVTHPNDELSDVPHPLDGKRR